MQPSLNKFRTSISKYYQLILIKLNAQFKLPASSKWNIINGPCQTMRVLRSNQVWPNSVQVLFEPHYLSLTKLMRNLPKIYQKYTSPRSWSIYMKISLKCYQPGLMKLNGLKKCIAAEFDQIETNSESLKIFLFIN